MSSSIQEPTALVATPRELDKRWTRIARGDRGCAFDALSLIGALLTVLSFALARSNLAPMALAYVCVGLWVLGFGLGTRAQWRSGKLRKAALREGELIALGVVQAEPQLQGPGKARVGKALVVAGAQGSDPRRDTQQISGLASRLSKQLQDKGWKDQPQLQALLDDAFGFARVPLSDPLGVSGDFFVTRMVVYPERQSQDAPPVLVGSVLWAIDDPERDFLEQAITS